MNVTWGGSVSLCRVIKILIKDTLTTNKLRLSSLHLCGNYICIMYGSLPGIDPSVKLPRSTVCSPHSQGSSWYPLVLLLPPDLSASKSFPLFPPLRTLLRLDEPALGLGSLVAGSLLALNVSHAEVTAWIIHHTGGFLYLTWCSGGLIPSTAGNSNTSPPITSVRTLTADSVTLWWLEDLFFSYSTQ